MLRVGVWDGKTLGALLCVIDVWVVGIIVGFTSAAASDVYNGQLVVGITVGPSVSVIDGEEVGEIRGAMVGKIDGMVEGIMVGV